MLKMKQPSSSPGTELEIGKIFQVQDLDQTAIRHWLNKNHWQRLQLNMLYQRADMFMKSETLRGAFSESESNEYTRESAVLGAMWELGDLAMAVLTRVPYASANRVAEDECHSKFSVNLAVGRMTDEDIQFPVPATADNCVQIHQSAFSEDEETKRLIDEVIRLAKKESTPDFVDILEIPGRVDDAWITSLNDFVRGERVELWEIPPVSIFKRPELWQALQCAICRSATAHATQPSSTITTYICESGKPVVVHSASGGNIGIRLTEGLPTEIIFPGADVIPTYTYLVRPRLRQN